MTKKKIKPNLIARRFVAMGYLFFVSFMVPSVILFVIFGDLFSPMFAILGPTWLAVSLLFSTVISLTFEQ